MNAPLPEEIAQAVCAACFISASMKHCFYCSFKGAKMTSLIRNNIRGLEVIEHDQPVYKQTGRIVYLSNVVVASRSMKKIAINRAGRVRNYYVAQKRGEAIRQMLDKMVSIDKAKIFGLSTYKL